MSTAVDGQELLEINIVKKNIDSINLFKRDNLIITNLKL